MSIKVGMVSLGCPKNQVDAEILLNIIKQDGFELTNEASLADVVIINTCGFIESAKQESIENILEFCQLKKEGQIKVVVVTGCLAERYKQEIAKEIPEADVVLGIGSNDQITIAIKKALNNEKTFEFDSKYKLPLSGERILTTLPYYAYLKIAEGCDNGCSYCAIPAIRGKFRSRPVNDIIQEAKGLAENGVKELILVAQDTSKYGIDLYGELYLAKLLNKLCEIEGFKWIRVLYCYPENITDELLETIKNQPKIVKYIDIPLQHADDEILKLMNRKSSRSQIRSIIKNIREKIPNITLRTTFIAGFPTENEQQFENLVNFIKEMKFERLGCFAYSIEDGTKAGKMEGQLDEQTKQDRADLVMQEQMIIMGTHNQNMIGKTVEIVVEGFDKYAECYFGRTSADAPEIDGKVFFDSKDNLNIGDFTKVEITEVLDYDLVSRVI